MTSLQQTSSGNQLIPCGLPGKVCCACAVRGDETGGPVAHITESRQTNASPAKERNQPRGQVPLESWTHFASCMFLDMAPHRSWPPVEKGVLTIFGFCLVFCFVSCNFSSSFFSSSSSSFFKYIFIFSRCYLDSLFLFFLLVNEERAFKSTSALDNFISFVLVSHLQV